MENVNFIAVKTIYFVGIGGIGMSSTANIAKQSGYTVVGSDAKTVYAPTKDVLDEYGIEYFVGYDAQHVIDHPADLYILSAGEDEHNPEVAYIVEHDLPYISFSELLYQLSKEKLRVVVSGTHGKSTTAGMLGTTLQAIDDSSFMVGAVLQQDNVNFHKGDGHYFVFEGDEYKATFDDTTPKFHYYKPDITVLTNVEFDHPDVFGSLEEIIEEFRELLHSMPHDGLVVYNADSVHAAQVVYGSNVASFSYGINENADFSATDIRYDERGTTFSVIDRKQLDLAPEQYRTQLPGEINVYNTLACIATLRALGFSRDQIAEPLSDYRGVKRRFEVVGTHNGITIIDDYAHHPTEVRQTLEAAKTRFPNNRIWAVFEPHTFSRTQATLSDLVQSFSPADEVLIAEIYPARESVKDTTIDGHQVVEALQKQHEHVRYIADKQAALDLLKAELKPGDVVIIMAVGSFNRLAYELLDALS